MSRIQVAHAGADYPVIVGNLADSLSALLDLADGRRLPVITDERVFALHGRLLRNVALDPPIFVPEGESAKDWESLKSLIDALAAANIRRSTPIIAFGGGSVGDVGGLAASLFKRGCPIVHVPTTLLAQVDSAIGGKTAIDAAGQKNLAGTFHHPTMVICDPAVLSTLDARQIRSGYAEVLKYGLIDDADFFNWCEDNGAELIEGETNLRRAAIEHCVAAKARFAAADPEDTGGTRALLNFGHTFGHAIEAVAGHRVLHGEAVAVGMILAFKFSEELGICDGTDVARVRHHVQRVGLPTCLLDTGLEGAGEMLLRAMLSDKKAGASGLVMILTRGIGKAFVARDVDLNQLRDFLGRQA